MARPFVPAVLILLIIFALIYVLLVAFRRGYSTYLYQLPSHYIDGHDLMRRCKTGDVIAFARARDSFPTSFLRSFSTASVGTDIFHMGIIGEFENQRFIFHIGPSNYNNDFVGVPRLDFRTDTHVLAHKLEPFIQKYIDHYDCIIRYYEIDFDQSYALKNDNTIFNLVNKYAQQNYHFAQGLNPLHFAAFLKSFVTAESRSYCLQHRILNCSMFVGILLEDLGFFPISKNPLHDYTPRAFHHTMYQFTDVWTPHTLKFKNQPIPPLDSL